METVNSADGPRLDLLVEALDDLEAEFDYLESVGFEQFLADLRRLFTPIFAQIDVVRLPEVDFDAWYEQATSTVGDKIGSGRLDWPIDFAERLSMRLRLILALGTKQIWATGFVLNFLRSKPNLSNPPALLVVQLLRPLVTDIRKYLARIPDGHVGELNSKTSFAAGVATEKTASPPAPKTSTDETKHDIRGGFEATPEAPMSTLTVFDEHGTREIDEDGYQAIIAAKAEYDLLIDICDKDGRGGCPVYGRDLPNRAEEPRLRESEYRALAALMKSAVPLDQHHLSGKIDAANGPAALKSLHRARGVVEVKVGLCGPAFKTYPKRQTGDNATYAFDPPTGYQYAILEKL